MVEQLVTHNIQKLNTLNSLQFVRTTTQNPILHKRKHNRQSLSLIRIIFTVKTFLVCTEYLGKTNRITTKIVHQHIIRLALLANSSIMIFSASENINVTSSLKQMVVISTFQTTPTITVPLNTLPDVKSTYNSRQDQN